MIHHYRKDQFVILLRNDNMKKDYSNYTVQIYLEPSPISLRQIFWRINPKELNWWERNFKNSWRQLYHQCMYHMNPYFSTKQYKEYNRQTKRFNECIPHWRQSAAFYKFRSEKITKT